MFGCGGSIGARAPMLFLKDKSNAQTHHIGSRALHVQDEQAKRSKPVGVKHCLPTLQGQLLLILIPSRSTARQWAQNRWPLLDVLPSRGQKTNPASQLLGPIPSGNESLGAASTKDQLCTSNTARSLCSVISILPGTGTRSQARVLGLQCQAQGTLGHLCCQALST